MEHNLENFHYFGISTFANALRQEHPRKLIPQLCRQFYQLGWVTGTGGGISIRHDGDIYIAPSGVQKERMRADNLFVQTIDGVDVLQPPEHMKFVHISNICSPRRTSIIDSPIFVQLVYPCSDSIRASAHRFLCSPIGSEPLALSFTHIRRPP